MRTSQTYEPGMSMQPAAPPVAAVAAYNGDFGFTSPTTYTTTGCYKAQAVDVYQLQERFHLRPGPG